MTQTTGTDYSLHQAVTHNGTRTTVAYITYTTGRCPACRKLDTCYRYDLACGGFAWGCQLAPAETTRNVEAGPVIVRLTTTTQGYAVTVEYHSTGQIIDEFSWATPDYNEAIDALTRRVAYFDSGTVVEALDRLAAHAALPQLAAARADRAHRPVAKGHQLDMSDPQATAILIAGVGGIIDRGQPTVDGIPTGRLTDTQIRAAGARGWVKVMYADGPRRRIIGCRPTIAGWSRARGNQTTTDASTEAA